MGEAFAALWRKYGNRRKGKRTVSSARDDNLRIAALDDVGLFCCWCSGNAFAARCFMRFCCASAADCVGFLILDAVFPGRRSRVRFIYADAFGDLCFKSESCFGWGFAQGRVFSCLVSEWFCSCPHKLPLVYFVPRGLTVNGSVVERDPLVFAQVGRLRLAGRGFRRFRRRLRHVRSRLKCERLLTCWLELGLISSRADRWHLLIDSLSAIDALYFGRWGSYPDYLKGIWRYSRASTVSPLQGNVGGLFRTGVQEDETQGNIKTRDKACICVSDGIVFDGFWQYLNYIANGWYVSMPMPSEAGFGKYR